MTEIIVALMGVVASMMARFVLAHSRKIFQIFLETMDLSIIIRILEM